MEQEKIFAVFGLGTFGWEVCRVLSEKGAKVIAVDRDPKLIERIKNSVAHAILMDSSDEDAIRNASLQDVDVAVVAIGKNLEGSIMTTIVLKNIGVPYIIARATSDTHEQVLEQIGATEILNVEIEEGKRLAQRILTPEMVDVIPVSAEQSLAEIRIPQDFVDQSIRQLDLRKRFNVNIISVKRVETAIDEMGNPKRKELILPPKPDDVLKINDVLVVLGGEKDIDKLKEL